MERFIGVKLILYYIQISYLKSSMERFIVVHPSQKIFCKFYLKSSMERFIVDESTDVNEVRSLFKIQYGEIYRCGVRVLSVTEFVFKIQYGEIYRGR